MSGLDWVVLAAYGLLMIGVGAWYSWRNRSADDYLLGGRRMSPIMLGLSLFATLVSTLSYLANPGEMIAFGPMMSLQALAHPLIFWIVGFGLIPLIMRQSVTSAYEILENRLGRSIRQAGAAMFLLLRFGWMATILYTTSDKVLVPLFKLDPQWTPLLSIALGIVTAVYSSEGGFKAVVTTDAIQSLTMLAGAVVTILVITVRMGGVSAWWPHTWPEHWAEPSWGFDYNAHAPFAMLMISTTLWYVCTNGSDQMSIQRFLSTRDAAAARKTLLISQITDVSVSTLLAITGVALLGFYRNHPPFSGSETYANASDKLFTTFFMTEMPPGLGGLVLAAVLAAAMSSLSSGLNSTCGVIERDFLSNGPVPAGSAAVMRLKLLTWGISTITVLLSLVVMVVKGNITDLCFKLINLFTAPLFGLFFLALFVRWATPIGAWFGLVGSLATAVFVAYAAEISTALNLGYTVNPHASRVWIMPSSLLVGVLLGSLVSLVTPKNRNAVSTSVQEI